MPPFKLPTNHVQEYYESPGYSFNTLSIIQWKVVDIEITLPGVDGSLVILRQGTYGDA
ncbi:hypothetical protein L207DRAFT_516754 [Hyaloscypha variabilis F]|jgi:hypothetical protein|uniref:Uncharacterized protein n=1 Tax=Hyaloscypha variabilis (strain UAMH 11265 / GT02V1 / F) TaxID=1149755 RepID=A0A2J6R7V5_HYAVF|nr:hypothetical protein L207DRAFT_516754 [Hyaloscypha variabilis F]